MSFAPNLRSRAAVGCDRKASCAAVAVFETVKHARLHFIRDNQHSIHSGCNHGQLPLARESSDLCGIIIILIILIKK